MAQIRDRTTPGEKHIFSALDLMRFVAALLVVLFHVGVRADHQLVPNAYLAVDMFFILSGFVIAHAYEEKLISGMTFFQFVSRRAIRLCPLYILTFALGVDLVFIKDILDIPHLKIPYALASAAFNVLFLPSPQRFLPQRFMFALDMPAWSLSLEVAINLVYALTRKILRTPILVAVLCLAACGLIISIGAYRSGDIGSSWIDYWGGFPRVTWAFLSGIILYRIFKNHPGRRLSSWAVLFVGAAVVVIFCFPTKSLLFAIANDLILLPLLVFLAAHIDHIGGQLGRLIGLLGTTSYALYITHTVTLDFLEVAYNAFELDPSPDIQLDIILWTGICLIVALFLTLLYDIPLRRFLSQRLMRHI